MQVNNSINCCKPRKLFNFKGSKHSDSSNKIRYKHYEEISEDVLKARSALKAQKDVQNSGKMRLFKAMPAITTATITTTLALTRPGKLSTKVKTGLGFLATIFAIDMGMGLVDKIVNKKFENKKENSKNTANKTITTLIGYLGLGAASAVVSGTMTKRGKDTQIAKLIASEGKKAAEEINSSKLGKFFDETITPFAKKHNKTAKTIGILAPLAALFGGVKIENMLAKNLSCDINIKSQQNFEKGKEIQRIARENFDAIDAIEV